MPGTGIGAGVAAKARNGLRSQLQRAVPPAANPARAGVTSSDPASSLNSMLLRHAIGAALRRIRLDDGRTLREVSLAANISMPYLSEIERGRKEPSSEILAGICSALGMSLVDLLQEASAEHLSAEALVVDLTSAAAPVTAISSAHEVRELPRAGGAARQTDVALAAA